MELVIILLIVILLIFVWLDVLAIVAVQHDSTLDSFQKKAQIVLILMVPLLGALLVLNLVNQHSPEAIPQGLVPWPLKSLVFGKNKSINKNRDTNSDPGIDLAISRRQDSNFNSSGGSDGGGGGD